MPPQHAPGSGSDRSERERVAEASDVALKAQPVGITFDQQKVKTAIPHLLRHGTLREYQHIGLDWLVSMYDNHFNGILAVRASLCGCVGVRDGACLLVHALFLNLFLFCSDHVDRLGFVMHRTKWVSARPS
jgi:hypothetical protein